MLISGNPPVKIIHTQVQVLRAIASLSVCIFHLVCGNDLFFDRNNVLKIFASYGYLGVQVFFIISGYIICVSLPENYSPKHFKTFLYKRIIRIEPPYLCSVILIVAVNTIALTFNHGTFNFSWTNFLYHLAYLNNFGLGTYYSDVYWTLGIEFQFYLLIGLLFPFIKKSNRNLVFTILALTAATFIHINNMQLIFPNLPYFSLGMMCYGYIARKTIDQKTFISLTVLQLFIIFKMQGTPEILASVFTVLGLLYFRFTNRFIDFLAKISFSLYLTHSLVGGKTINLLLRIFSSEAERYLLLVFSFICCCAFAWMYYVWVEKPALLFSKRILYK